MGSIKRYPCLSKYENKGCSDNDLDDNDYDGDDAGNHDEEHHMSFGPTHPPGRRREVDWHEPQRRNTPPNTCQHSKCKIQHFIFSCMYFLEFELCISENRNRIQFLSHNAATLCPTLANTQIDLVFCMLVILILFLGYSK